MRVKRLEIQGFKSFKDKTIIHFDHTITGIVGPNGCGKSNIVDAFFWVMGEQSYKHMRGSQSEDLIFNGSSKYAPLGIAEATLVLETPWSDFNELPSDNSFIKSKEISVTRKLYRSGEGEYYINGTLSRLKDIQELFMDTGVGTKGYSVIEQGQIGKIVNSKPEERRLLIEEAAGIAKYKARKKESLRKMQATQLNLERLSDILQEIEKNLQSLERQAIKARQYQEYKDQLFEKEIRWGQHQSQQLEKKINTLKSLKEKEDHETLTCKTELQVVENQVEVNRLEVLEKTKLIEGLQQEIQERSSQLSEAKSSLDLSRRRQSDLLSQQQSLESEKQDLNKNLMEQTQKLQQLEQDAQLANQQHQEAHECVQQSLSLYQKARQTVEDARKELNSIQKSRFSELQQISQLNSQIAAIQSRYESSQNQVQKIQEQLENKKNQKTQIELEFNQLKKEWDELQKQKNILLEEKKEHSAQLSNYEDDLHQAEQQKQKTLRHFTQLKSKLQSLEELQATHEGLDDGTKSFLDWAHSQSQGPLHFYTLTDLISIDLGYEVATAGWFSERMQTLISENPLPFNLILEKLKQPQQGQVRFQYQPILKETPQPKNSFDTIKTILLQHDLKPLGTLSHFIHWTAPQISHLVLQLQQELERVWVLETFDPLIQMISQPSLSFEMISILQNHSFVSLEGIVFDSSQQIRGGQAGTSGTLGLLRRKRHIEELKEALRNQEKTCETEENIYLEAQQILKIAKTRWQTLQNQGQTLEIKIATVQSYYQQTERLLKTESQQIQNLEQDFGHIKVQLQQSENKKIELENSLNHFNSHHHQLEEQMIFLEPQVIEKQNNLELCEQNLQNLRIQEASLQERSLRFQQESKANQSLIADRQQRLQEIEKALNRTSQEQSEFQGEEPDLKKLIEILTIQLTELRTKLGEFKATMSEHQQGMEHLLERAKKLYQAIENKNEKINQLNLEIEKIIGELSHLTLNLEEKYGIGCLKSLHEDNKTLEISLEEETLLRQQVHQLKECMRKLGEVNLMAIEEYDQLKQRFEHLSHEKSDLDHSLKNLQQAIDHINKTSEERFQKAFNAIADRFSKLFPIIFGGGQAELSLVYPEGSTDILEAGVDIIAQPPGKKVSNITLLSGGEKALTAISLIFAIFMIKPSPFCVLDEVDAPLDDANIGKFNALLREMSAKSQFILITHNKKTMELNDTLYGVTMEEPGVSKMVSIEMA